MALGQNLPLLVLIVAAGCGPAPASSAKKKEAPAKVEGAVPESQLATITLTDKAVERLGVRTVPLERKTVERVRTLGGEIVAPPGSVLAVAAALSGTLGPPPDSTALRPGAVVRKGQPIFTLLPLLSPESRVSFAASRAQVAGDVEEANVQLEAAKIAFARAADLFEGKAGSQREVDEATARVALAEATLRTAQAKHEALDRTIRDLESGSVAPIPIESPLAGILEDLHAQPGQSVPAGAALFAVFDNARLWVRLPVYVGDVAEMETGKAVRVGDPAGRPGTATTPARPVLAPPSADPAAATVDFFYELDGESTGFRPGQRVGVAVSMKTEEESLVVPWSAVLHDFHGGTWVYEAIEERKFRRRRVQVRRVADTLAVLDRGPDVGSLVVTDGAAELFGTEFGIGK